MHIKLFPVLYRRSNSVGHSFSSYSIIGEANDTQTHWFAYSIQAIQYGQTVLLTLFALL